MSKTEVNHNSFMFRLQLPRGAVRHVPVGKHVYLKAHIQGKHPGTLHYTMHCACSTRCLQSIGHFTNKCTCKTQFLNSVNMKTCSRKYAFKNTFNEKGAKKLYAHTLNLILERSFKHIGTATSTILLHQLFHLARSFVVVYRGKFCPCLASRRTSVIPRGGRYDNIRS